MSATAAFDAAAATYDRDLTEHRLGRWLRDRVQARLGELFPAGSRALELGCGTGEDAVFLARRGALVRATDVSENMLTTTKSKALAAGVADRVEVRRLDLNRLPDSGGEDALFDGAYSNFGAVNCVEDRHRLAEFLASAIAPGGKLLLVPMPRFCLFEVFFHALRGRFRVATRRFVDGREAHAGGGGHLRTWYPSPGAWARQLRPWFEPTDRWGLGLILPPTDLRHLVTRFPRVFGRLEPLDRRLCRLPGADHLADHFVIELRRTSRLVSP